jgi:hypothetical protein
VIRFRVVSGLGLGAALLSLLTACTPYLADDTSPTPSAPGPGGANATPAESLFGGTVPVSIATWWRKHPETAPADLSEHRLLFNKQGDGSRRFAGPDIRQYTKILMVITCQRKVEYVLRLQALDGLSIATTTGTSCGGPTVSSYTSPPLTVVDAKTEVEVEVPVGTTYFVTIYGAPSEELS